MRPLFSRIFVFASLALATPTIAQTSTAPGTSGAPGTLGGVSTPNSGQLDGPGSPTGTGIGGTDGSVLPNVGGNGFQNNTSLNGASSSGSTAPALGAAPKP